MSDDTQALQDALAGLHAAIWAYGEVGSAVSQSYLSAVSSADNAHRAWRENLEAIIRDLGAEPVASEPGYTMPAPLSDDASALAFAASIEDRLAQQWRYCCGRLDSPEPRTFCVDALTEAAGAALRWRQLLGAPIVPPFPGAS